MAAPEAETELLVGFGAVEGTWQIQPSEYSPIATIPTNSIPQLAHCVLQPAGPPSIFGDPWKVVAQPVNAKKPINTHQDSFMVHLPKKIRA